MSTLSISARLEEKLQKRKKNNLQRKRISLESAQQPSVVVDGVPLLNFCSNDYLGLANNSELKQHCQQAIETFGVGSGASHLVVGHHQEHALLEEELAEFVGAERALVFSSGYAANLGVLSTILNKEDNVFQDRLNHASLLDGGLNSGARFQRYLHSDVESLTKKLHRCEGNKLIVSDAVFSMDGDVAPISELIQISKQHDAWLMLDDAHGFGVLGESGSGSVSHAKASMLDVDIYMATFGKALGTSGAFVAGSNLLIESLIQFCRTYIYTTALPPALASTTRQALRIVKTESWRREKLVSLIAQFRKGANDLGLSLCTSETAIQPILIGEADKALEFSEVLKSHNILVTAIRPPTVPEGSSRLRVTLSAEHTEQDVQRLLDALSDAQSQAQVDVKQQGGV